MFFGIDNEMLKSHITDVNPNATEELFEKRVNLENTYTRFREGDFESIGIPVIINPFDTNPEIWGNLNKLFPTTDRNEFMDVYYGPVLKYFSLSTKWTEEEVFAAIEKISKMIIPTSYIPVSP